MLKVRVLVFVVVITAYGLLFFNNVEANSWSMLKPSTTAVPEGRANHGLVVDKEDNFWVFGGGNLVEFNHNALEDIWKFNGKTNSWGKVNPKGSTKPPPMFRFSTSYDPATHSIFVFGGQIIQNLVLVPVNSLYSYSISSNTWTLRSSSSKTPSPRYFHNSVIIGRSMYVFGGISTSSFSNELYIYQIDSNEWSNANPQNTQIVGSRSNFGMTSSADGQNIYVFAGAKCFGANCLLSSLVRYSISDNSWSSVQVSRLTPPERSGTTLTEYRGNLYAFGGSDIDGRYLGDFWRIHLGIEGNEGEWLRVETIGEGFEPEVRNNHRMRVWSNKLVMFGGHNELLGRQATFLNDICVYSA